uniref:Uncharacterized protein n=1 Tax=Anguilla anguilla TaxID=7936 RepID=A0A0E9RA98_ANGAN
MSKDCCDHHFR